MIVHRGATGGATTAGSDGFRSNTAVTTWSELIVTVQLAPAHAPLQPENVEPGAAVAVSDTTAPRGYACAHVVGHAIPEPVTVGAGHCGWWWRRLLRRWWRRR